MKTVNKKAILGVLAAIVISLGAMQGISVNKQNGDTNLQELAGAICAVGSYYCEDSYGSGMMSAMGAIGIGLAFQTGGISWL